MSEWISVKDQLPPTGVPIKIWIQMLYFTGSIIEKVTLRDLGYTKAKQFKPITHWMPFPKCPEEK